MGFGLRKLYHVWGWAFRKGGELTSPTALNSADAAAMSDPNAPNSPTTNALPPSTIRRRMLLFFVLIVLVTLCAQMVLWSRAFSPTTSDPSVGITNLQESVANALAESANLSADTRQNRIPAHGLVARLNNQANKKLPSEAKNFMVESGLKNRKVLLSDPEVSPALVLVPATTINLLDLPDFRFLMLREDRCPTSTFPFVVVIHSAPENWERRMAIRDTWGRRQTFQTLLDNYTELRKPSFTNSSTPPTTSAQNLSWSQFPVPLVFLVGTTANPSLQAKIEDEFLQYDGDIVQGSFIDAYRNLTYKHVMGLLWVNNYCAQARLVLKTDDDVFVNLPLLMHLHMNSQHEPGSLKVLSNPTSQSSQDSKEETNWANLWNFFVASPEAMTTSSTTIPASTSSPASPEDEYLILCDVVLGGRVARSYRSKWRTSKKEFDGRKYPPYCNGWAILYSQKTAARLLQESYNEKAYFFVDDVFVTGILAQQVGIKPQQIAQQYFMTDKQLERISKVHSQLSQQISTEGTYPRQGVEDGKHGDSKKEKNKNKKKNQVRLEIDMENLDEAKWDKDSNHVLRVYDKLFGPPQLSGVQVRRLWDWYRFVAFVTRIS